MRIVFIGTGEIGLPALHWLLDWPEGEVVGVYTQPDRPVGRKLVLTPPEVKTVALARGIPVYQPEKLRQAEAMAELEALKPDLIVVMAYGQILSRKVIELPTITCINLHASILPRHRGAAPIQGAIRDGDQETGVTVMYVDVGLDTGDQLLTETCPILDSDTGGTLHDKLAEVAPVALSKALPLLQAGEAPRQPQDEALVTYDPKLGREDGEIQWSQSAEEIERLIRAYDPWPGTYTMVQGKKLKILPPTEVIPGKSPETEPGTVLPSEEGDLIIACGSGALKLKELQLEGRKRLEVKTFLAGQADLVAPGKILGK